MKVVVTFDIDEKSLDDLVVMAKVYRKKDGYKEFVSVENNLPLKPLPSRKDNNESVMVGDFQMDIGYILGWNECLDEITGEIEW